MQADYNKAIEEGKAEAERREKRNRPLREQDQKRWEAEAKKKKKERQWKEVEEGLFTDPGSLRSKKQSRPVAGEHKQ
jgi:hypothetical protein